MRFRPHWSFTAVMLPFFVALLGLGVWQLERLDWKEKLIATMYGHMHQPPITLGGALKLGDAAQYHRVSLTGTFDNAKEAYVFTTGPDGGPVYHVLTPFTLADGRTLLVDRGYIPIPLRDPAKRAQGQPQGRLTVVGVWRTPDRPGFFTPRPDPAQRIWYARDVAGIAAAEHLKLAAPVLVEADATPNPGGWPKGGQTIVDLPNDHLQYAITWFLLAFGLFCIWLAWHVSSGRLR